jgi:hypothetical protein
MPLSKTITMMITASLAFPSSRERPRDQQNENDRAVKLSEQKCQGVGSAPGLDPVQSVAGETFLRFLVGQSPRRRFELLEQSFRRN